MHKKTLAALAALLLLAACASGPGTRASHDAPAACANLKRPIAAALIGLPGGDANMESAALVAPSELSVLPKPPFSPAPPEIAVVPATPEYCKVIGAIAPVDPKARRRSGFRSTCRRSGTVPRCSSAAADSTAC